MNINELDSYNLADAVKFNEELNPRIWQGSRMRPEVRRKLLAIARDFKQSLGLSDLEVKDITLSGSNAGYTYTPHSDIDLHLVVDVPRNETDEVYRELFNAKKYQYNDEHNLSIGGYPVELYVQPANQTHHSQGIYSVLNNDWTAIPRKRESTVNDGAVKSKYELMKHRIDSAIDSNDINRLTRTAARIKQMRQAGLDKNGELGPENLAYKMLRTQGLIEKLYTARTAAKDQQLSLQERKKKKKSRVRYGFGGYYTPGFAFGGEAGEGGGDGGGGESMREDATISPYGVSPTTQMFLNETGDSEQTVYEFISHAAEQLGIDNMPTIELHTDPAWSEREHSFGRYTPNTHTLEVNLANRHIMDILRTVAHELVHCRQHELSPLPDEAGKTGSRWENEAHAKAGELMRDYADANPNRFGEHALAEASGYIPTKAQAKDKRFSTALTVDVHPGQTGKEANKMGLQTDAQGRPALLMKEFANQLHEEFAQFDESTALFEIKMTGKNLRAEAAKTGAIAGMEFEMIVPNVEGGDEDAEPEPDWDYDESVGGISDAVDFFDDAGQNSRRDLDRLRERMQENYNQWLSDQFQSQWERDDSEFVFNYIKENASPEEIAEILDIELDGDSYPDTIDRQALLDATEKVVAGSYANYWYNQAYENAQEEFNNDADQESEWLEDQEINTMQDVMNTFGMVDWPHWNTPSGGDRSIEDVANDFQDAIGRDVQASTNYHAGSVDRPSTSSHHYVVEPDGSLTGDDYGDRGLEFVSPPLPIDVIINDLNKVKRWAKSYGCYTNNSTGLHINISVPDYSRDKLDFVKLAILMGDEYVSDSFGRLGAFYAKSAMGAIRDNVRSRPEAVADALEKMRTHMNTAASKAIHAGVTQKFTSINVKDGHIEFRSPGGDWLGENFDKIENTLLRFTVAMSAALNPEMYREEYLKKLYKILNPEGQKDEYGDMIQEFSKYMASLQGSGTEASGKLSKETQQAIKDFRTAASKELKQKNLANKLKKGDTAGQKYWWKVSNPGNSNSNVEVVATTKQEAIEKAISADGYPSWANNLSSLVAKPLSPYYEKSKPSVWKVYGSNSSPYQRLGTEVIATDEFEAMQKARQKWNLNVGGRTEEEFFSTNGWSAERIGEAPAVQTTKYEIYNKQTGNSLEPADGIANDADALVRLNDYIEHGPHTLNREQATAMFGIRTNSGVEIVDIDIPMAQGRAATSVTGQWKVVDGLNRELYRFRPAENTRAKANELAALWARENNFDGNYQVEPAEDTAPALTPDQQQGGLIDIAGEQPAPGSTTDLAQQRATPGTFTGAWKIIDNDGNEMHRFSGVGNNQRDANRVATQWVQNNGYAYGTEIDVVPIMSESIAEDLNELTNTSLKVKEPKNFVNVNDRNQVIYKVMKFKSGKNTYLINFTVKGAPAYGKKSNWNAVNVSFGVREEQDDYSFGDEINTDLTARNKNQFLIYSTVINAVRKFITEYNTEIDEIIMQGAGERQAVMYQRFFQSAGKYFPGWHYDGKHSLVRDVPRQPVKKVQEQGVAEGADPDKKYTIKKSYTMSKAGVEKSVWHIMDGDFVVDVTDLRRDAKYYADKWNAAEKESSNASQNLHKQDVTEGLLNEFAPGEGGFGPFKVYISTEFIEEFATFDQAKEEIDFLRTADPKSFDADWKIIDGAGKTVWQHDPGEAIDAMRRRSKIQFLKPDDQGMTEVFEPGKQNWKWRRQSSDEAFASFVVGDREYQWHAFSSEANPAKWEIQFRLMRAATDPAGLDLFGQTGTGNSAQVLSTAVDITRAFLEVYGLDKVEEITFNAKEDSRIDLYVRMIKRLLPNWDLSSRKSNSYGMQFTLTDTRAYDKPENKIAQGVAEGKQPGQPVVNAILRVMPVAQEIWFHGSRATGKHRKTSDTDILVVVPDDLVGDQYLGAVRILQKLSTNFDNYDIQPTKSGTNIHLIAQEEGRLLWSNKPKQGVAEGSGPKEKQKTPESLDEAFDQPYPTTWEKSEADDSMDALARLPDGSNLSIMFNMEYDEEGEEVIQVEFHRNNSQEVTGDGDAQRVFATVLSAIQQYIKTHTPKRLTFSASKEVEPDQNSESRAKLYDRLVMRYARTWGYRPLRADTGSIVRYELSRLKPVTEAEPGKKMLAKQGVAEGKLVESAVFLNPNTVVVGQEHGQPLELSPNTLKQIQAIADKHGAWYEGNGTDRTYTKGQIDRYVGSWDDEVAKIANSNNPKWLYVLFANVDANNRVQRVGVDPKDTIRNRLLATAKDNSFQGIGYTAQALQKFLQLSSEGKYDFVKMSQQPATQENLTRFLKAGEALMWPDNWEQYPNKAGKIAKAATVDVRDQYLATRKAGVYITGSGHLKAVQNIIGKQGMVEGLEFFSMPLRMSEYRGKTHPATNEPYDAKFKFSGDLKDRVHGLLDAGTKPTLLQVNPRHLLATQDWLSTQGGGKPPFATMKQHPVVLQKNNKLYILDGHHRSADAHKSGSPIEVYLFRDEL